MPSLPRTPLARSIVLIAHNIRSVHNVGSLLRTADGLGVDELILTGYSPYPQLDSGDTRLPHLALKLDNQIHKTALGAERTQAWRHEEDIHELIILLKQDGYTICALEQDARATPLNNYHPPKRLALIVGREVEGIEPEILARSDQILEIPMYGAKESFNVVQAAAMALYQFRFMA